MVYDFSMKKYTSLVLIIFLSLTLISCDLLPSHTGSKVYEDGSEYIGEFSYGKRDGTGTYTTPDGETYVGEFKDDKYHGQGTYTYADGATYVGEWKDNERHGLGTNRFPDGATYDGWWKDGKPNGQGRSTFTDGETYIGGWKDGKWHGQGTYTYPDGETYIGEHKDGRRNGQGTFTFSDGATYVGGWKDGKWHGQGTLTSPDGKTYVGEWKDGELIVQENLNLSNKEINIGVILGFTGPIESLTPAMASAAELAMKEASDSGALLDGATVIPIRADSTCIDAGAAISAAERLINSDQVVAIMGADCSGVTTAIANSVAIPNGVTMISPSATSPALTTINDKGYFFRTAPSDARQGQVLAQVVMDRGIDKVAVTYTNNDYGKGLSNSFVGAFKSLGGTVTIEIPHEDGKGDYSAEVGTLSASGAYELVVLGYLDQGGRGIIQNSLDTGAFSRFILADGTIGQSLIDNVDGDLTGSFGTLPGSDSEGAKIFTNIASSYELDGSAPYAPESYDAAALLILAMQAGGSADRSSIANYLMSVANAPGEKIYPGEIDLALKILSGGGKINYEGATNVEFSDVGEAYGSYKVLEINRNQFQTARFINEDKFLDLNISELIGTAVMNCWSIPLGIPYDENSKVSIKISFNKDGTFLNPPEILEQERMDKPGEEYFRVIAESALRALRRCFPDESLDFKNYDSTQLSNIILNFDPTEILR